MRRIVVAGSIVVAALTFAAAVSAHHPHLQRVSVQPSTGGPNTQFVVSFGPPPAVGGLARVFQVQVKGIGTGCAQSAAVPATRRGRRFLATLKGPWCPAAYRGKVTETERPICRPHQACPQFIIELGTVGRFSFAVTVPSVDTIAPTFAGLQSAFACTPGPQRPGQTTPFTLGWQAAKDNITPASEIVYDVFMSTTSGGEDFSHPNWTTTPGVTTFKTPGLASHGTFYFVVRARDQAGNEDQNKVERRGVDPCV